MGGGGVVHDLVPGGFVLRDGPGQPRIVGRQPSREFFRSCGISVMQAEVCGTGAGSGNGGTDSAASRNEHPRASGRALVVGRAHESLAVEHVAQQAAVAVHSLGVARPGNLDRGAGLIQQFHHGDLMWHGDEGAVEVPNVLQRFGDAGQVFAHHAHGNDHRVDAVTVEVRVVDHGGLERPRRVADMGDEAGIAVDHERGCRTTCTTAPESDAAAHRAAAASAIADKVRVGVSAVLLASANEAEGNEPGAQQGQHGGFRYR